MGTGKVEDSKVKEHGMKEAAWPGRELVYWKNYRFIFFSPLWIMASDCYPVASVQLNLCGSFRGHSDTQHKCTPFIEELKFWQVPLRAAVLLGMFGNLQRRMQTVWWLWRCYPGNKVDKRTQSWVHDPESLLLFWVLLCVLSFPPWAGPLESTRKA